jgi:hypothetical protein
VGSSLVKGVGCEDEIWREVLLGVYGHLLDL